MNTCMKRKVKPDRLSRRNHFSGLILRVCCLLLAMAAFTELYAARTYSFAVSKVPFATAVKAIEKKTNYSFVYETDLVNEGKIVSVKAANSTMPVIVKQLIKGQDLQYRIEGNRVYLSRKGEDDSSSVTSVNGKNVVSGKVTDANGEPLVGATVALKAANIYGVTDADGNFTMSVPTQYIGKTVEVSYVGFETAKARLRNRMVVTMKSSSQVLDDLVVVGYGTQKKESLTSAISTVGAEDISRSAATTTSGALVGKIAGINSRMNDGRPGAATRLNIRNMGTPLYVVDGVQVDEGQFNNIDFNDIENISVLKDASASIYGVRAANGVVVVTTKSGKRNMPNQVNINAYMGFQEMFRFPKAANATDWVGAWVQSSTVKGETNGKFSYQDYLDYKEGRKKGFDWFNYTFQKAPQYYVNASTQGGSDKINYYFSVGHIQQDAILRDYGNFNRTNIQVNINANITDNFKLGAIINGRLEKNDHPAIAGNDGNDDYWTALFSLYRNWPTARPYANDNPNYPAQTSSAMYNNPALIGTTGEVKNHWRVLQSTFNAEWEIIKGLKLKGAFTYFYSTGFSDTFEKSYKLYDYDANTDTYNVVADFPSINRWRSQSTNEDITSQVSLSYDKVFANVHKLSAFVGSETYTHSTPGWSLASSPLTNSMKKIYFEDITGYGDRGENTEARAGFMGRVNYEYDNRYLFEFAARYDGSWKFPPKHRWGFFPSVSGGWRVSEEKFWNEDLKSIFSNLKLRASYGVVGDDNISGYSAFDYLSGYNYASGGAVLDGEWVPGSSARNLPVTHFSWIKATMADVGFDVGFFNNQLTGSFDLFRRLRKNLPASRYDKVLPSEIGFGLPVENLNSDMTKGLDWAIAWQSNIGDFNYTIGGNMTFARSYNWHQYKPRFSNSRDYFVYSAHERVAGATWALDCIGQFQNWEEIANYPVDIDGKGNSTLRPGDLIYADRNGDGQITGEDQHAIAYQGYESASTPLINFGINLGFNWKGVDFSCDFTGAARSSFWFNFEQRTPFWGDAGIPEYMIKDSWHLADMTDPNSELIPGKYPMLLQGNQSSSNYTTSTFWMTNVRYLKLRNLELGYTFPVKWTKKAAIQKLRVYTLMQNLFSIDNVHDRGIDPEINSPAGFSYPTNRVINFGVNVQF